MTTTPVFPPSEGSMSEGQTTGYDPNAETLTDDLDFLRNMYASEFSRARLHRIADRIEAALASRSSVGASEAWALDAAARKVARDAYLAWDNDNDSRVGKLLRALAGETGIRPDLDDARAALSHEARP